jgi:SAM-dependent methyltransferase
MRDYTNLERYLNTLAGDIYPQPEDEGHTDLSQEVINRWMSGLTGCESVLDVGCGEGFCQPMFEEWGIKYTGICLGADYLKAKKLERNVQKMDFNFLDYKDESFDLIFSRHSLEHSPMPIISLLEWHRVSKHWLGIVLPAPEHYGFGGLNHYSVMNEAQIEFLISRSGWKVIWKDIKRKDRSTPLEYWYMCEKIKDV